MLAQRLGRYRMKQAVIDPKTTQKYITRKLTEADVPDISKLYLGNPEYFKRCLQSHETVKEYMLSLPPTKGIEVDFFLEHSLIAVMGLIDKYPDDKTAFMELFMVTKK